MTGSADDSIDRAAVRRNGLVRWLMLGLAAAYAGLWPYARWEWRRNIRRCRDALSRGQPSSEVG